MDQISIMEWTDYMRPKKEPLLRIGQTVHEVKLDIVRTGKVESVWDCGNDGHGYTVLLENGYTTTLDGSVGTSVFTDVSQAAKLAEETAKNLAVIRKDEITPTNQRSWRYSRADLTLAHGKPYAIYATISMVGNKAVYVEDFMLYPFFHVCKTEAEAKKIYRENLKKILEEVKRYPENHAELSDQVQIKDMYRVSETLYSGWEYAITHGRPFMQKYS